MGKVVYIMGRSGTGKSHSMINIPAENLAVINVQGKDFPFGKTAPAFKAETIHTDDSEKIIQAIKEEAKTHKIIVVDDFQYVMTNEFMRRVYEKGYDKWNEIARHAWDIVDAVSALPDDVIVYIMCHTDRDEEGNEKIKTLGQLLDDKVVMEGMATIVLKSEAVDGKYYFFTQNSGKDTVKSPDGMFPSRAIPNDLKYVDEKIRNYWDLPGAKSDKEIAEADKANTVDDADTKKGRGRSRKKTKEDPPKEEKKEEKPKTRTRKKREIKPVADKDVYVFVEADNNVLHIHKGEEIPAGEQITGDQYNMALKEIALNGATDRVKKVINGEITEIPEDVDEEIPYGEELPADAQVLPADVGIKPHASRRRRRKKADDEELPFS